MADEDLRIPLPVVHSRFTPREVLERVSGEHIAWGIGDPAFFTSQIDGMRHPVVIDSKRVGHPSLRGKPCYEVKFILQNGIKYCVPAAALSIRDGWKAMSGAESGAQSGQTAPEAAQEPGP